MGGNSGHFFLNGEKDIKDPVFICFDETFKTNTHRSILSDYLLYHLNKHQNLPVHDYKSFSFVLNLFLFYSAKDLTIAFGHDNMLPYYLNKDKKYESLFQKLSYW